MNDHVLERDSRHRYWCVNPEHKGRPCDGVIFESVTTILGNSVPKDLSWYGMQQGVYGVKGLTRMAKYDVRQMKPGEVLQALKHEAIIGPGVHGYTVTPADRVKLSAVPKYDVPRMSPREIEDALKREHLTVNDHRDEAGRGGTVVHKALEDFIATGAIPNANAVPEAKRASIRGLAMFIVRYKPEFVASEVKVVSVEHAYAGTFDFLARIRVRFVPAERGKNAELLPDPDAEPSLILGDLKNSKWVYPTSHFPQLEAYEGGRIEAGETPSDYRAVLWVNGDGEMQLVPSMASFADFLALRESARVIKRLDKSWKRPRRKRS